MEQKRGQCKQQNKRRVGHEKELLAAKYLRESGFEIIHLNFYSREGEIDLIAKEGEYLVFVEVKYRRNCSSGYPEEAVTLAKQRRIIKTARYYMLRNGIPESTPCRFDVIAVENESIRLIRNAFGIS